MKTKKMVAAATVAAMAVGVFGAQAAAEGGSVYYLNYKPEVDAQWQELAASYTEQTGVPVTVVTAASGTYEQTLTSEIAKSEAPTLFQVENQSWLDNWGQYCYDLSGSFIAEHSTANCLSMEGVEVAAVPFANESYGIIYNVDLLNEYCGLENAVISSPEEINNFDKLKAVADDIQARKDELGVEGAFTSAGLDGSSNWRFTTHLANMPIYWELTEKGVTTATSLDGTYVGNYKNLIDLYFTDSTCDPALLSGKTGDDSLAEFCDEMAVFYQNGTWAWTEDGDIASMNIAFLPLYTGVEGEENIGVCTGTGNYWCINKNSSEEDIQATLDFLEWVVSSDEGKDTLAGKMAFNVPFDTFADYELANPLFVSANAYEEAGKTAVSWIGTENLPTENWKSELGSALIEYSQGTADWSVVEKVFTEDFATEWANR
ncbi:ABC transporter, solute-binding protein [Marvinbryantia formatexigens DSM 14469]|uniref:ABC transporter, solute-binding protein n=1 Tax=Marvinbryantia formatexigens DSM 14469 TaxID=478749 RepID=C6L950_9FIRM|nr:ABC transporter substrate-binding protein [Marvinbryantia formatexigens]EET62789.1 ABC transporter, solute-binding protein [Marvinbryantia formatexigens DSM 14469]UWO23142.1 ABC transporter substrate-binding protein [Marvinbryantia formatexigens DSM 14469]SDG01099.1 raffinose/stachyose/melibiose transport system substrate-binding protein [Marvinbryantia formatexigens]